MINKDRIAHLYVGYKQDTLSSDEQKEWQEVLQDASTDDILKSLIIEDWTHLDRKNLKSISDLRASQLLEVILIVPQQGSVVRNEDTAPKKVIAVATIWKKVVVWGAAALVILSLGLWWTLDTTVEQEPIATITQDIMPGGNRALLTLANGQKIDLDESNHGIAVAGDHIRYIGDGKTMLFDDLPIGMNTLSIPNGGQYRVDLPDGTRVWMNSASTLKYPSQFDTNERVVELEGEGYFEVTHSSTGQRRPFIVKARGHQIEVLGTSFSVSAYANEPYISSVLVEGKVRLLTSNGKNQMLHPNERVKLWLSNEMIELEQVEAKDAVSWKDGMFYFDNTDLNEALRVIGRWYDVEFVSDSLPKKRINGVLPKHIKLHDLISMLSETTGLDLSYSLEKNGQNETRRVHMNH